MIQFIWRDSWLHKSREEPSTIGEEFYIWRSSSRPLVVQEQSLKLMRLVELIDIQKANILEQHVSVYCEYNF